MVKIAPSLLAADFLNLKQEIETLIDAGVEWLHLDIMDNHYVPNLSFGPGVCRRIKQLFPRLILDVHLMATPVDPLIVACAEAGADYITIHHDAAIHLQRSLSLVHQYQCRAGLAFNPGSDFSLIRYLAEQIDLLLFMSVNPGFGGQPFLPNVYLKLKELQNYSFSGLTSVDGGINRANAAKLIALGTDVLVVGSTIFNSEDYSLVIRDLQYGS